MQRNGCRTVRNNDGGCFIRLVVMLESQYTMLWYRYNIKYELYRVVDGFRRLVMILITTTTSTTVTTSTNVQYDDRILLMSGGLIYNIMNVIRLCCHHHFYYIYIRVDVVIVYFVNNIEKYTVRMVGMLLVEHDNFFVLFIYLAIRSRSIMMI